VRRASRLIAVSEALQCELTEVWPEAAEKTVSIPNGVDTSAGPVADPARCRATFELPLQGPLVGMMARLAPGKGIDEFIRAGRLLADRWPEVRLVVAGDGPLRGEAQALCAQLGMEGRLYLVGEIASPRELVGALDMLVVASTSEGSSVAAMEAMASGKPVVATAVGGVPEVVADGETGVLVRPGDPEALAAGIEALLRDPEKARRMGEHGRQRAAAKFDVRQMVARTKQVYADLLRHELEAGGTRR
jgi:glycosyltransferase involved in cell wall biosynthesis